MLSELFPYLAVGFNIYVVLTVIFLLLDNRDPTSTLAWVLVFIFFPGVGVVLYIFIGRNWRKSTRRMQLSQQLVEKRLSKVLTSYISEQDAVTQKLKDQFNNPLKQKLTHLLYNNSNSLLTVNNDLMIFHSGEQKFEQLKTDLRSAKSFIHMEYFIWRSDPLTQSIKTILIEKAKVGVEVRILYDAIGSFFLDKEYIAELREAGVKIYPYFNFLSPWKLHTLNYRNHRKVVVIDGKIGYNGGMNMGNEYITGGKRFDFWRDTHLRIEGEAVAVLQGIFTIGWFNTTNDNLFSPKYFVKPRGRKKNVPIQITTSGPDSQWPSIKQLYFSLITSADQKVYIQSPYFVPDLSVFTALKTAALSGLDVRFMMTGIPDKKLPYWSAHTYFKDLLKAGVRIFHYKKGFMHAKTIMVDNEICSVGTANMDVRSFNLNYEINTLIYSDKIATDLEQQFHNDSKDCKEFTLKDYKKLPKLAKFRNSLARLLAPLL